MTGANYRGLDRTLIDALKTPRNASRNTPSNSSDNAPSSVYDTSFSTPHIANASNAANNQTITVNALWLSDIHLGCKDCKADYLLNLLNTVRCQHLYLVGDIVDLWALKRRLHWPESHNKVLQKLIELAQNGTQVMYLPGNHDELIKPYAELTLLNIKIARQHIHQGIGGHKLLMLHGDQFDADAVAIAQDRAAEKAHFVNCGVPCAPYAVIETAAQLEAALSANLLPGILKTARMGYDGKGQVRVNTRTELAVALAQLRDTLSQLGVKLHVASDGLKALRMLKASHNAADDGLAGVQQLAGDATLLFYMTEEAQEGRDAYAQRRSPDFAKFPRRP